MSNPASHEGRQTETALLQDEIVIELRKEICRALFMAHMAPVLTIRQKYLDSFDYLLSDEEVDDIRNSVYRDRFRELFDS